MYFCLQFQYMVEFTKSEYSNSNYEVENEIIIRDSSLL